MSNESKKKVVVGGRYLTPRGELVEVERIRFQFSHVKALKSGEHFSVKTKTLVELPEREQLKSPVDVEVEKILGRFFGHIETFEERGLDSLDFADVNVKQLKQAVEAAFAAGRDFEARRSRR